MAAPSVARIDRTSSIENEPRTLNFQQIQCAREAASYVVNTRTIEEACQIFTQGMQPVARVVSCDELRETRREEYSDQECSCCFYSFQSTKQQLRDAFSAPF